jgi:mannosyltransferase
MKRERSAKAVSSRDNGVGRDGMSREFDDEALDSLEVVIPNLNWRYSGGTSVNRTIAPLIAKRWRSAWCGPDRPDGIAALSLSDLARLRFRPPAHGKVRIWHARRNVEMLAGLFLNLFGYRFALIFNSASQREKTWLTHFLISRMDAVIATSDIAARFLRRPATVILHGIDVDLYSPPDDRIAAFAKTGLPGKYGIGTFGRVRRQKGCDLFVAAMCRLLPHYPDFCALVVGLTTVDNLPFVEGLKQQIQSAGLSERIRFLGELPIEEVPVWYKRISIYVFASRVEGFGLTMLEAMAAGDALVATRAGAAEMIITDGDDGVLAPVDDVEALVAALEPLMREPERIEAMGRRARKRVVSAFSRDREADEISAVYRQVWAAKARLRLPSPTGEGRG